MDNKEIISVAKTENGAEGYSALALAYLGDCVYELYVRSYLLKNGNQKVNDLHRAATKYVCAKAQAEFYNKIRDILSEEEQTAFRRGRNTKSHPPKNADVIQYKIATGVEALIGYLSVIGDGDRVSELMEILFE